MGQHAAQLFRRQKAHDAVGHGNDAVFRVASRGEGVGSLLRHDVEPGLGHARPAGEVGHHVVHHGGVFGGKFLRAVHGQHDLVGKPEASDVHDDGEHKGDENALTAAEGAAHDDEHGGKAGHEKKGFKLAGHNCSSM